MRKVSLALVVAGALIILALAGCGDSTSDARKAAATSKGLQTSLPAELKGLPTTQVKECNLESVDGQPFPEKGAVVIAANAEHTVLGWMIDKGANSSPANVWVRLMATDGTVLYASATPGVERPDVAQAHGAPFRMSGFKLITPSGALTPGGYMLTLTARSGDHSLTCEPNRQVTVN